MSSGNTCLFNKGFCTVLFNDNEQNALTISHIAQGKHAFMVKKRKS